ncbi:hypothetical protein XELAEV_18039505mg [Xenopus laevis]|uniref:Uncharacterized protein n=1 Tax=Xenopus laevis TaxID=8355 RepID=A0A974H7Z2_XENLA|nr:hypothetical protein XELAEV_18039505mg [Xenopus laevis]
MKNLIKDIKKEIVRISLGFELFELLFCFGHWLHMPRLVFLWSEIIPRKVWRYARSHEALDTTRITINREIARYVKGKGEIVVKHKDIEFQDDLLREDGAHLNKFGLDLFNLGLQEGLEKALAVWKKMNA